MGRKVFMESTTVKNTTIIAEDIKNIHVINDVDVKCSIDKFKEIVIRKLGNDMSLPIDACDVTFSNINKVYGYSFIIRGIVEIHYHCSIGYAYKDIYTEYEEKYDEDLGWYKTPVTKTRTLYKWSPYNGVFQNKYNSYVIKDVEINNVNSYVKENELNLSRELFFQNSDKISNNLKIPGDVNEDYDFDSIICKNVEISAFKLLIYKTNYIDKHGQSYLVSYDATHDMFLKFNSPKPINKTSLPKPKELNDLYDQRELIHRKINNLEKFPNSTATTVIKIILCVSIYGIPIFIIIQIICKILEHKAYKVRTNELDILNVKINGIEKNIENNFKKEKEEKLKEVLKKNNLVKII